VVIVPIQSFTDSSRAKIVERHVQCAQSPMHFAESAAPSGSSRLHSSMNFGSRNLKKKLQLLFATTLTITLRHSDVIVV